jgi:hypothetical protein
VYTETGDDAAEEPRSSKLKIKKTWWKSLVTQTSDKKETDLEAVEQAPPVDHKRWRLHFMLWWRPRRNKNSDSSTQPSSSSFMLSTADDQEGKRPRRQARIRTMWGKSSLNKASRKARDRDQEIYVVPNRRELERGWKSWMKPKGTLIEI